MTGFLLFVATIIFVLWLYTCETKKEQRIWNGGSCARCGGRWKIIRRDTDAESSTTYLCACKCRIATWFLYLKLE